MFLEYAKSIKAVAKMPVMVTGGFRTLAGMEAALQDEHTDMIGLARPFCLEPDFPKRLFNSEISTLPTSENQLVLGKGYWGPNSSSSTLRTLNNQSQAGWYYRQIELLGAGLEPQTVLSPLWALGTHLGKDFKRAIAIKLA